VYVEFLTKDDYFPLGGVSTDDQHQALGAVNAGWISNHVDLRRRLSEQVQGVLPRVRHQGALPQYCGCLNWQTTGSINGISPVLCRYEQMLLPIADRVGEVLYKKRDPLFLHKHYNSAYPVLSLLEDTLTRK